MSKLNMIADVKLFLEKFELLTPPSFVRLSDELHEFRSKFFEEELTEYEEAVEGGDLETALDSLIDLVYIIIGTALFHGLTEDECLTSAVIADEFFSGERVLQLDLAIFPTKVALPDGFAAMTFVTLMRQSIEDYNKIHYIKELDFSPTCRKAYVTSILGSMLTSCLAAAEYSSCSEALWDELWIDVQRANMSKEKALRIEDSKRSSVKYDVIKPSNWVPPQGGVIIARHLQIQQR